jgi:hypothetical protein
MTKIVELKISIADSDPEIFRTVQVPISTTLRKLHHITQNIFNWGDDHLHEFDIKGHVSKNQESKISLADFITRKGQKFFYLYDFGDSWEHILTVNKIFEEAGNRKYPLCIGGQRNGPLEDSGGIWGYEDKMEILKDKTHPDYDWVLEWVGEDFDPDNFDIEEINKRLK